MSHAVVVAAILDHSHDPGAWVINAQGEVPEPEALMARHVHNTSPESPWSEEEHMARWSQQYSCQEETLHDQYPCR